MHTTNASKPQTFDSLYDDLERAGFGLIWERATIERIAGNTFKLTDYSTGLFTSKWATAARVLEALEGECQIIGASTGQDCYTVVFHTDYEVIGE